MTDFDLRTARRKVASARQEIGVDSIWRHIRRGGQYRVETFGLREDDGEALVVYRNLEIGTCWIRPVTEFLDGRFERMFEASVIVPSRPAGNPPKDR